MDRRSFIIGAGSAIITTSFYRDVLRFTERKAAPLIITPDNYSEIIYALPNTCGGYDLYLGTHPLEDQAPRYTWRQFNEAAWGYDGDDLIRNLMDEFGLESEEEAEDMLDRSANTDTVLEWYLRYESASARAFHDLQELDLVPIAGTYRSRGEIRFIDGPCPGNDSLITTAEDMTSLSLLQARLNEINAGLKVEVSTW